MKALQRGMSLIEMVVAITITAIIASFSVSLVSAPSATLENGLRRSSLRESSSMAMAQIGTEMRSALPNSVRFRSNGAVLAIEYLRVIDSATLFVDDPSVPPTERLQLGTADGVFETLDPMVNISTPYASNTSFIALHHTGLLGRNAYRLTNVISPAGTNIQITSGTNPGQQRITLSPAPVFNIMGVQRKVYLLGGAVTVLCDRLSGALRRYSGYSIAPNQNTRDSDAKLMAAGATRVLLASGVNNCRISNTSNVSAGQNVLSLSVTFLSGGESVRVTQAQVNNNAG